MRKRRKSKKGKKNTLASCAQAKPTLAPTPAPAPGIALTLAPIFVSLIFLSFTIVAFATGSIYVPGKFNRGIWLSGASGYVIGAITLYASISFASMPFEGTSRASWRHSIAGTYVLCATLAFFWD